MSEIEKMYRNVLGYVCNMPDIDCFHECEKCDSYITFTAEKQIELIKLFAKREVYINFQENKYYIFTMNIGGSAFGENLENALARYINKVWQDLTSEEKQQVKGILE